MKNSWLIWFVVVGVVVTVLVAFNYQDEQASIPLSEIFPDTEEVQQMNIEYEFVEDGADTQEKIVRKTTPVKKVVVQEQAAQKITAPQEIVEPVTKKAVSPTEEIAATQAKYSIQVASFKTKDRAEKKASELAKEQLDAFVLSRDLAERGTWYRVYVGKFGSKTEAGNYLGSVRKVASDSFIISLK